MRSIGVVLFLTSLSAIARADHAGQLAASQNRFALELYREVAGSTGNVRFGPHSASNALAMTLAGARGETAAQMAKTLHLDSVEEAKRHSGFRELNAAIFGGESGGPSSFRMANRLWGGKGLSFVPNFLETTRSGYGAEPAPLDFAREPETSRVAINAWVADRTNGKILDLLQPSDVTPLTRLVLTNAVSFRGKWAAPFKPAATSRGDFQVSANRKTQTPFMRQKSDFPITVVDGVKFLRLPHESGGLSMVVILPDAVDGLAKVESRLSAETLAKWNGAAKSSLVDVALPKFRVNWRKSLREPLKRLGTVDVFNPGASDLTGIATERDLAVGDVIHKAFVDVYEEGTEAAAATAVTVFAPSPPPPRSIPFVADHPFLFMIQHDATGAILFMGRMADPGASPQ